MTRSRTRAYAVVFASVMWVSGSHPADTQTLYTIGQSVQPVYEGWERRPDGSFDMVFGYLNRNYVEEPEVPIGTLNSFSPGPADRGQPTHFYPRRQSFVFRVTVPADWGEKTDLVWTVTHNGLTAKAVGSLWPVWEIDEGVWKANRGGGIIGRTTKEIDPDQPPMIKVVGETTRTIEHSRSVALTVSASDDGKPGPQRVRRSVVEQSPERTTTEMPGISPRDGPSSQDMVKVTAAHETGLAVSWIHYRGAGTVTFEPRVIPIKPDGKSLAGTATTTVRFSQAGTYVVRALADDGILTAPVDVTVVVKGGASTAVPR